MISLQLYNSPAPSFFPIRYSLVPKRWHRSARCGLVDLNQTNLSAPVFALFSRFAIRSRMLGDDGLAEVGELISAAILLETGRGPRVATV